MNLLDLAYVPLAIVTAPWWLGKRRHGWRERFGSIEHLPPRRPGVARVMLHAVSVGEVAAIRALVPMLADRGEVVVSVTTDTGLARARELYGSMPGVFVVRYPLDFSWAVARVLDRAAPDAVALVELEVWPNFVKACARRGIPIAVINGRLSARSFRGYRRARVVLGPTFRRLTVVAAQDEDYAERFRAMGVEPARVRVTGSMKWDAARIEDDVPGAAALAQDMGIDRTIPLIVAGSTAEALVRRADGSVVEEPEEALIVRCVRAAAGGTPVQVLCAPRKPDRFDRAAEAMPGCTRRSAGPRGHAGSGERAGSGGLFVLDTIGELRAAYALATVVVIGRSFGALYGSDPVEPISLGKPTVIGPRFGDFESAARILHEGGGLEVVADEAGLTAAIARLLRDPESRSAIGARGRACIRAHQGSTRVHAGMLMELALSRGGKGGG